MLLIGLGSIKAKFSMTIHGHAIIQSLMAAVKFSMIWHHREFSVSEAQRHSVQPHTTWQCLLLFHLLESFLKSHMKRHLSPWNEASPLVKMSPGDWFPCYIISRPVIHAKSMMHLESRAHNPLASLCHHILQAFLLLSSTYNNLFLRPVTFQQSQSF